jgi:DNA-binding transcriptional LysR family regulator
MELRLVKAFLVVADEGSITAAAKRLHATQSALSRQIKALEDELGVALLDRGAHSISLTAAGKVLVRDGGRWVMQADQISERVRAAALGEVIKIGYSPSLAGSLLGPALERFSQLHAGVRVQLSDCSTAEMKAGLVSGGLNLILTVPDDSDGSSISWEPVERRRWRISVGVTHELAAKTTVSAEDLADQRFLMYRREDYPDYWRRVTDYCRAHGLKPKVVGEFDGFSSLSTAVESGMGVALVADGLPAGGGSRMRLLPLDPEPEPICVAAGWASASEPSAACQVLIEELKRAVDER